jgi:hypothetical protein
MEQNWYDAKSVAGTLFSFVLTGISVFTLNEWATVGAIAAGFTTAIYTSIKIYKEIKTKK